MSMVFGEERARGVDIVRRMSKIDRLGGSVPE